MVSTDIREALGKVHIYCGDGKGKTTAACGLALRALGNGLNVVFVQFLKDGDSGEIAALSGFANAQVLSGKPVQGFVCGMTAQEKAKTAAHCLAQWQKACQLCHSGACDLLILDEILSTISHGFVPLQQVVDFLQNGHGKTEIVLTGREPAEELKEVADYVSQIVKCKHPYDCGLAARKGIEK